MSAGSVFSVLTPGFLSTIQDSGRHGYQQYGVPESGVMDTYAARVANILVGNTRRAALLEITLTGPALRALRDTTIAVTGADLSPTLGSESIPNWHTVPIKAGQTLRFGRRVSGARAYLAVTGGFDIPPVLGSRATFLRGTFGGLDGRPLRANDLLSARETLLPVPGRGLRSSDIPHYSSHAELRVVPGPHLSLFSRAARATFYAGYYVLDASSDRMGYRLTGPSVSVHGAGTLPSEAVPFGAVQIAGGQPLLLMADRQTTGGYSVMAVVISADLPFAAQCQPGDTISFRPVLLPEAHAALLQREQLLSVMDAR